MDAGFPAQGLPLHPTTAQVRIRSSVLLVPTHRASAGPPPEGNGTARNAEIACGVAPTALAKADFASDMAGFSPLAAAT